MLYGFFRFRFRSHLFVSVFYKFCLFLFGFLFSLSVPYCLSALSLSVCLYLNVVFRSLSVSYYLSVLSVCLYVYLFVCHCHCHCLSICLFVCHCYPCKQKTLVSNCVRWCISAIGVMKLLLFPMKFTFVYLFVCLFVFMFVCLFVCCCFQWIHLFLSACWTLNYFPIFFWNPFKRRYQNVLAVANKRCKLLCK
jgi:hypothetical protein